jgi:hypothetical protein
MADKTTHFGRAGEFFAMSELLLRGWNVAVPVVDVGDDAFVIDDNDKTTWRLQVKSAEAETMPPPPISRVSRAHESTSSAPPSSGFYGEELPTLAPPASECSPDTTPTIYPTEVAMVSEHRTLRSPPPPSFDEAELESSFDLGCPDEDRGPDTSRDG